jgi:thiol-disulfide isomerase/thioredoxin
MRTIAVFPALLLLLTSALAQNEQAPIIERDIEYKDWTYKSIRTGDEVNLRKFAAGKKLVIVVYFAPWCNNWRHDAPMLQRLYDKYRAAGLEIIAVGEYDPLEMMKANLDALKVTFPAVYESQSRAEKTSTLHFGYRRTTGDDRNWGSPWYIFLTPATIEKKGDALVRRAFVINGEMIEEEGEKFIRDRLGLAAPPTGVVGGTGKIEVCDPNAKPVALKRP